MKIDAEIVKKRVYERFGWHLTFWAKQRGFSQYQVYDFLRGKAGKRTSRRILEALRQDNIFNEEEMGHGNM